MTLYSIIYNIAKQQEICLKGSDNIWYIYRSFLMSSGTWPSLWKRTEALPWPPQGSWWPNRSRNRSRNILQVLQHTWIPYDFIVDGLCYCLEIVLGESFQELTSLLMQWHRRHSALKWFLPCGTSDPTRQLKMCDCNGLYGPEIVAHPPLLSLTSPPSPWIKTIAHTDDQGSPHHHKICTCWDCMGLPCLGLGIMPLISFNDIRDFGMKYNETIWNNIMQRHHGRPRSQTT